MCAVKRNFPVPNCDLFRIGIDPEVFVKVGRKLLPAFEFLPEKDVALWTALRNYRFQIQGKHYWDGFQAEFSYNTGVACLQVLTRTVRRSLQTIHDAARRVNKKAKLSLDNVVRVPQTLLDRAIEPHVALGCMPSGNIYGMHGLNVANPRKLKYRMAGGHMHFEGVGIDAVEVLDKVVGVWAVGASEGIDNPIRRQYYGLAGEHRLPLYGLEYRVLSNFYYGHPALFNVTWDIARKAVQVSQSKQAKHWLASSDEVIRVINENDVDGARKILRANRDLLKHWLGCAGYPEKARAAAYMVGMQGAKKTFLCKWGVNIRDISTNWMLNSPYEWTGWRVPAGAEFKGLCQ